MGVGRFLGDILEMTLEVFAGCSDARKSPLIIEPHHTKGNIMSYETYDDVMYLDKHYGGAPDECSRCYIDGHIVKLNDCDNPNH